MFYQETYSPKHPKTCFFSGFLGLGVDGNKQVGSALDLVAGVSQVSFHSDDPKWIEVTFSMEDGVKL